MATFYILHSMTLDRYYIGHTTEPVEERLRKHLSSSGTFTSRARDWRLVYHEDHENGKKAYAREREVKGWKSRKRVEELISAAR